MIDMPDNAYGKRLLRLIAPPLYSAFYAADDAERNDLLAQIHELQVEVAELRDELAIARRLSRWKEIKSLVLSSARWRLVETGS